MRVLHIAKAAGIGGSERHLLDLLPGLVGEGVEARMLVLRAPGAERFLDALEDRRIAHTAVDAGRDANPSLALAIRREIRRSRPDLVHTHLVHADVYGQAAARLARVPGIASMHSTVVSFLREPARTAERIALRTARRVIAISSFVAAWLEAKRLVEASKIDVVRYGVDPIRWSVEPDAMEDARRKMGLPVDGFVVGIASRLVDGKGHLSTLTAIERAAASEPRVLLAVAGIGPLEEALRDRGGAHVRMLGFVDDVRGFLAACDAVVVPSDAGWGEGFGLVALEAMATGRPVVVTDWASLPEVVGDAGVVVPPGDAEALARAIVTLARDPVEARRLGEAGRARAAERYGLDRMVRETIEVYRSIR